jgi:hypothetical protein
MLSSTFHFSTASGRKSRIRYCDANFHCKQKSPPKQCLDGVPSRAILEGLYQRNDLNCCGTSFEPSKSASVKPMTKI